MQVEEHTPDGSGASSSSSGSARTFLGEGPLVLGRLESVPTIQFGMPENMMTWQLTPELPCLKASSTAFMFAVPFAQHFYILQFMPGGFLRQVLDLSTSNKHLVHQWYVAFYTWMVQI